jgi:osmotically-inducible protein OsmY
MVTDFQLFKGYETLILRTTNGIVIISGTVDHSDDVQKINDQVKSVEGVKSVNNQLNVKNK